MFFKDHIAGIVPVEQKDGTFSLYVPLGGTVLASHKITPVPLYLRLQLPPRCGLVVVSTPLLLQQGGVIVPEVHTVGELMIHVMCYNGEIRLNQGDMIGKAYITEFV